MFNPVNFIRLAGVILFIFFSGALQAQVKPLQLLARYDTAQPALQLAEPISSAFRNKVIKVAMPVNHSHRYIWIPIRAASKA